MITSPTTELVQFLILVLQLVELVVDSAIRQQFLMSAHFADLAFVHDDDLVGTLDGREAVGNDQRGASFDHAAERVAHFEFGFGIDARSGFVEDQNLRLVRQGAGERDELLLSGRKRRSALANLFVESVGQAADEVGEVHIFGGLGARVRPGCARCPGGCCRRSCR